MAADSERSVASEHITILRMYIVYVDNCYE